MNFLLGFAVWAVAGLLASYLAFDRYRGAGTTRALTFIFGIFGAFIGGMLGTSAYIFHDPEPLRVGGILGALAGGFFFAFLYHFIARKAV